MGKERRRKSRPDSPGKRTVGRGDDSPGNRTVGRGDDSPGNRTVGRGDDSPGNRTVGRGDDSPGNRTVGRGDDSPGNRTVGRGDDSPGKRTVGRGDDSPGNRTVGRGDDSPGNRTVGRGDDSPGNRTVGRGDDSPGNRTVGRGDDSPGNRTVGRGDDSPGNRTVGRGDDSPGNRTVGRGDDSPGNRTVGRGDDSPGNRTVGRGDDSPGNRTVGRGDDSPGNRTVGRGDDSPGNRTVGRGDDSPGNRTVGRGDDSPGNRTVGRGDDSPGNRTVGRGDDSPGNRTVGRGDDSPGNRTVRAPSVETGEDDDHDDSHGVMTRLQPVVVMGVLLTGYVATLHPSLPGGDAGELIVSASELGVAHPPGYPLYTVLVKAFCVLVPWGSVAWRANLLTAILAAAAAACLCHAVCLLSNSLAAGWLAAGLFGFSRLTWAWAVTAEVFGLNDLLLALLLATAVHFSLQAPRDSARVSQFGALVCGLCLSNQHTTVIYIAVLVPWVLYSLHARKVLTIALMLRLSAWFVAGLSPYAYLPLSSALSGARWTWGDQTTWAGFLTHLLRREYGTLHLLKDHEGQGFIAGLIAYFEHVGKDLTSMVPILCVTAVFSAYKRWCDRRQEMLIVLLTMVSTYTAFFAWRANLDIHKPLFKGVMERFWLQSDLVVVAMAAVAFSDIFSMIHSLVPVKRYHADKVTAVMLVSMQIGLNLRACDQSSNRVVEDFALTTLRALPPGALVLTKGDLPSNSLRYFHLVEGVRPDIALFDQEVLTYDWSIPKLGGHSPGIAWPGDRLHPHSGVNRQGLRQFTFLQLLDAHYHRKPIFGCIGVQDHEPSWEARYYLRPFGVCVQFIQKGSAVDLSDWLTSSRRFAANWSHPVPVSDSTWEDVASTEMWRAKTAAGLFLLESVDSIQNPKEKASLLRHAYKVYSEAMESGRHFPSYWHKNFALVCEKLRHVAQASETMPLLHTTVAHFRAYLASGTPDPQTAAIQDAIGKLQDYLDFVTRKDQ